MRRCATTVARNSVNLKVIYSTAPTTVLNTVVQYVSERDTSTYVRTYVTVETRRDCGRKVVVHNTQAERHVVKVAHLSIIVDGFTV